MKFIFVLFLLPFLCRSDGIFKSEYSLRPPYVRGQSTEIENWEYSGAAVTTESYVRLVPSIRSRAGYMWGTIPNHMKNWRATIEALIHNNRSPGADGMAFWLTKDRMEPGQLYGNHPNFVGLGIIVDTFDNDASRDGPNVMAVHSLDGNLVFDHETDGEAASFARCQAHVRNTASPFLLQVSYINNVLTVKTDVTETGKFEECFSLVISLDFDGYYFGVTAATGGFADYHDLYSLIVEDMNLDIHPPVESDEEESGESDGVFDFDEYKKAFLERLRSFRQQKQKAEQDEAKKTNVPEKDNGKKLLEKEDEPRDTKQEVMKFDGIIDVLKEETKKMSDKLRADVEGKIEEMSSAILNSRRKEVSDMERRVAELESTIQTFQHEFLSARKSINSMTDVMLKMERAYKEHLGTLSDFSSDIRRDTSFGFWIYFFLFQAVFGIALYWFWRKYKDDKKFL